VPAVYRKAYNNQRIVVSLAERRMKTREEKGGIGVTRENRTRKIYEIMTAMA